MRVCALSFRAVNEIGHGGFKHAAGAICVVAQATTTPELPGLRRAASVA
jgi:hypothetical protein